MADETHYGTTDRGKPVTTGAAMLMASYDDGSNIGFWDGLRRKRGKGWLQETAAVADPEWFVGEIDRADPENRDKTSRE